MKLSQCKIGEVVTNSDRIGHIVGLKYQYDLDIQISSGKTGDVIPLVLWAGASTPIGIHHQNINLYKD